MHTDSTHLVWMSEKLTCVQQGKSQMFEHYFSFQNNVKFFAQIVQTHFNLQAHISHGLLLCMIPPGKTKQRAVIAEFLTANAPVDLCVWAEQCTAG